ncbi:MAG: hypothetical protein JW827_08810 [Spirochaetes bacterium]|nr:hypothetical protein [Spirochaetota bacterium]
MQLIYTHTDFDGVVSASLISLATRIDFIRFVSTARIWYEPFTGEEIVCDLPCPWNCRLWFDHHESNLNEMKSRGIDVAKLEGKFELAKSCAQIIYEYYKDTVAFPSYFPSLIEDTNMIDSMDYDSIEKWREETSSKILAATCQMLPNEDYRSFISYLIKLSKELRKTGPEKMITFSDVKHRYETLKIREDQSIEMIKNAYYFHPSDNKHELVIIDMSESKMPPRIDKNLVYLIEPQALCVLLINAQFKDNKKTNDLKFSVGINFTKKDILEKKHLASIFEKLGIGGGHKQAAGAIIKCHSKEERLNRKEKFIKEFLGMWRDQ